MSILVYTASIFTSAFLLFLVQPMVAKLGLPYFGGSPQVWNTCLLFFQVLLLGGYAYAHLSVRLLGARRQLLAHLVVIGLPLLVLPPMIAASAAPKPGVWPVPALLLALGGAVGLPFFALSTNGTLIQRWYSLRSAREPYFLYAASNTGSLLALLAYPFIVEPRLGLQRQTRWFALGYIAFVLLNLVGMAMAFFAPAAQTPKPVAATVSPTGWQGPLRWTFRSMVTSMLLVATTLHVSTDVGAVPLLWILPLSLYLLTFIIAFVDWLPFPRRALVLITGTLIAFTLAYPSILNSGLRYIALPLALLFFACWVLHADLARDRPPPEQLTSFYLWISVGGALGSVFCNLIAPLIFVTVAEYAVSLALLAILLAPRIKKAVDEVTMPSWLWAAVVVVGLVLGGWLVADRLLPNADWVRHLPLLALLLGAALLWKRTIVFVAAVMFVGVVNQTQIRSSGNVVYRARSFFGTVKITDTGSWRSLVHGSTNHGMQHMVPDARPTMYYHPSGPMGWVGDHLVEGGHMAVIGLGTGSMAGYVKAGQSLTYYEIDKMVPPIAKNWFTFVPRVKGKLDIVLGDARLSLKDAPDGSYDVMIIDAFSSDAIPVHLLTREALELYLQKAKPTGVVLVHISNRYLDLVPVLRAHAKALGVQALMMHHSPTDAEEDEGASASDAVVLTKSPEAAAPLIAAKWEKLDVDKGVSVDWTDDRSSLLSLFRALRK
jgi:spermidine synthase